MTTSEFKCSTQRESTDDARTPFQMVSWPKTFRKPSAVLRMPSMTHIGLPLMCLESTLKFRRQPEAAGGSRRHAPVSRFTIFYIILPSLMTSYDFYRFESCLVIDPASVCLLAADGGWARTNRGATERLLPVAGSGGCLGALCRALGGAPAVNATLRLRGLSKGIWILWCRKKMKEMQSACCQWHQQVLLRFAGNMSGPREMFCRYTVPQLLFECGLL